MSSRFRPRSVYDVMAAASLFVALGGTAYAVSRPPANSVGPRQIQTGAVRSKHVKDRSLRAIDFRAGDLPRGRRGPKGDKGSPGAPGMSGYITSHGLIAKFDTASVQSAPISCGEGRVIVDAGMEYYAKSGGGDLTPAPALSSVLMSTRSTATVTATRPVQDGASWGFQPYAVCVNVAR